MTTPPVVVHCGGGPLFSEEQEDALLDARMAESVAAFERDDAPGAR